MSKTFTPSVNLIAAVDANWGIGLNGELPWKNSTNPVITQRAAADMRFFQRSTANCVIVVGHNTYVELCKMHHPIHYWNRTGRVLVEFPRTHYDSPEVFLNLLKKIGKDIWIAGGAKTYERLLPFVDGILSITSIIEYNGPADTYFPYRALYEYRQLCELNSVNFKNSLNNYKVEQPSTIVGY